MKTNSPPPTARIYQFPRTTSSSPGRPGWETKSAADHRQRAVPSVEFGSGWYHEAAVQAEQPRKS